MKQARKALEKLSRHGWFFIGLWAGAATYSLINSWRMLLYIPLVWLCVETMTHVLKKRAKE